MNSPDFEALKYGIENLWLFLSAVLVLMMQPGFAFLEAGVVAARNTVNTLFKNFVDWCVGLLAFLLVGYSIMFGKSALGACGDISLLWPFLKGGPPPYSDKLVPSIHFLYEFSFAATTATIVSGAVTSRIRHLAYLGAAVLLAGFVFPLAGHWVWHQSGWLAQAKYHDFAGSTVVHVLGGTFALIGAAYLGPRLGQFEYGFEDIEKDENLTQQQQETIKTHLLRALPAHNVPLTLLGVFLLWLGWYGFNPGSVFSDPASPLGLKGKVDLAGMVALNTTIAAGFGALGAMALDALGLDLWPAGFGRPRLTVIVNGSLGGLVAITANCDLVTPAQSIVVGLVAGVIVIATTAVLTRAKIDDVAGVFPVHGACGIWGGISGALLGEGDLKIQLLGLVCILGLSIGVAVCYFGLLSKYGWLRIRREEEMAGVDVALHRQPAYSFELKND